uniref:Uncharacterized protein n=1 Tax=Calidris pygmaea TaxID=425635 RepID=A0A8C3KRV5_9CHAR
MGKESHTQRQENTVLQDMKWGREEWREQPEKDATVWRKPSEEFSGYLGLLVMRLSK